MLPHDLLSYVGLPKTTLFKWYAVDIYGYTIITNNIIDTKLGISNVVKSG